MIAQNQQWIKQGYFVDAKDKNGDWQGALVLAITKSMIKIRFDGWSARNDQFYPLNTQKLKPFRSITHGYTGPVKGCSTREHWKFSLSQHQLRLSKFEQFTNSISQKSAFEINQYIRGQHYFYINYLLTLTFNTLQEFSSVYDYFKVNIIFLTKYLNEMTERETTVWFSHHASTGWDVNLDSKIAYSEAYYELFDTMSMIGCSKNSTFVRGCEKFIKQFVIKEQQSLQLSPQQQDVTFQYLITKQLIKTQFLSKYQKLITKLFDQTFAGVKNIPLQFILSNISLLSTLEKLYFAKQTKKKFYLNLLYIVKEHIGAIQFSDVKTNERLIEDILSWIRVLAYRLGMPEKQDIYKWVELNRLKLWAMMIQCDVLEKKLRGITKIKQFYELIISKLSNPLQSSTIVMSRMDFHAWVSDCNLIKLIFQLNEHTEVIKKGCDMFLLFYGSKYKLIAINQLTYIWQTCFSKHEAIKKVVFQFWLQLSEHVNEEQDLAKFIGVLVANSDKINEKQDWEMQVLFNLLKSLRCHENIRSFRQLVLMIYIKTMNNIKYIPQLGKRLSCLQKDSPILKSIIDQCLEGIRQKDEHVFHLKLLSRIFTELKIEKMYIPQNLIPTLIEELRLFLSQQQTEKLMHSIFHIFNEIMSIRPDQNGENNQSTTKITLEHFETLWQMFRKVENYQTRKIFYAWIVCRSFNTTYNFSIYTINQKFSPEFRKEIFFKFLCDNSKFNLSKIDLNEFIVFREFFIFVNAKLGHIEYRVLQLDEPISIQKKIIRVRTNELKGMEYLWEIFIHCPENIELINTVCAFIRDLYMRTSSAMLEEQKSHRVNQLMQRLREFIIPQKMILQNAQLSEQLSNRKIRRALILTAKLLLDINQRIEIPKEFERLQKTDKLTITVYVSMNESKQIDIYTQEPFITIKQRIGKVFGFEKEEFTLLNDKTEVEREMYEVPYYLHGFEDNYFRLVSIQNEAGKKICECIYDSFYHEIISYLKSQQLALESYNVLEMLEIHDPLKLYHNLSRQINSVEQIQSQKRKIYLHIYFLRVIQLLIMNNQLKLSEKIMQKLVSHLGIKIENQLIVNYLEKLISILAAIRTNYQQGISTERLEVKAESNENQRQLRQQRQTSEQKSIHLENQHLLTHPTNCTTLLLHLLHYINHNLHKTNQHEYRLFDLTLAYYTNSFSNQKTLFNTFIRDHKFKLLMEEIFLENQAVSIRKVMEKKIGGWVKDGFFDVQIEKDFAQFFIHELNYKIHQKSLKKPITNQYMGTFHLFRTILQTISPQTYHLITTTSLPIYNHQSLPIHLIQSLKQQNDSPKDINYLLNGQLQMLIGLIKRQRELINMELVEYLLYECLIYLPGVTMGIDVKCLAKENVLLVIELLQLIMIDIEEKQQNYSFQNQNNSLKATKSSNKVITVSPTPFTVNILTNLQQFNILEYWRTSKDWSMPYEQISRTKYEFVGLENPGCICYINSLLQQLFMIGEFRWAVLGVEMEKKDDEQKFIAASNNNGETLQAIRQSINSPQLIPKLKLLFLQLLLSERPSIDPLFFTSSLHTTENRPLVKIFQQMDIDEFSMILFDKIQNHLHHLGHRNFVRELFGGTYSNEIISLECRHSSERQEQFLSISLDVKKHITQGFMSLVKGEILQGENAYFCEQCDRKVKAMKRLSIKRLPPQLIISLRRFEFDYEVDQKIKINKYCEFPLELDLESYSQEKLNQTSNISSKTSSNNNYGERKTSSRESQNLLEVKEQQQQEEQLSASNENNNQLQDNNHSLLNNNKNSNYFKYRLKGVVIHSGSADSGHYYSFIENNDGRWFEFNDEKVTEFDVKSLEDEAFGARDGEYVKIKNAYLLFYQRVQKYDEKNQHSNEKIHKMESQEALTSCNLITANQQQNSQFFIHISQPTQTTPTPYNLPQSILTQSNTSLIQQIIIENKRIRLFHFLFSRQYSQFITNNVQYFLSLYGKHNDESFTELLNEMIKEFNLLNLNSVKVIVSKQRLTQDQALLSAMFKYILGYAFCIQLRQKDNLITVWLFDSIKLLFFQLQSTSARIEFMEVFLESSLRQQFVDEFLIQCPKQKPRLVSNFLIETLKTYLSQRTVSKAKKGYFIKRLFKLIMGNVIIANTNLSELIMMLRKVLFLGEEYGINTMELIQWMIKRQFISILIENLLLNPIAKDILEKIYILIQGDFGNLKENQSENPLLFGKFQEKTKTYPKSTEKQTWTFLWHLLSYVRMGKQNLLRDNPFLGHINFEQEYNKLFVEGKQPQTTQPDQVRHEKLPTEQNKNDSNGFQNTNQNIISHSHSHTNPISPPSVSHATQSHKAQPQTQAQSSTINEPIQMENNQAQNSINKNEVQIGSKKGDIKFKFVWLSYIQQKLYDSIESIKYDRLMKIISQQKDTKSAVALSSFITEFTRNSKTYSDLALAAIQQGLKDYESTKYRPFFICIEKLMEMQDGHAQKRRLDIFRILRVVHRHNEKYFNQCDYIEQWILRYASRFDFFQTLIRENPMLINEIRCWITQKRLPGGETLKKHRLQSCERLLFRLHGIMVSSEIKDYESFANYKSECFQKIKTREFNPTVNYPPLNIPNQQYSKGDQVECYFDHGNWVQGIVDLSYYGIVLIVFGQNNGKTEKMLYYDDEEKIRLKKSINSTQKIRNEKMEIQK